jgi:hypothetical protein
MPLAASIDASYNIFLTRLDRVDRRGTAPVRTARLMQRL